MLRELHVSSFALIDRVDIEFGSGLNLLTGETGAGKSILIDALGLALGERSSGADQVRSGADKAVVEALFDISDAPDSVRAKLDEYGVLDEGDETTLTVAREVTRAGKSVCRVNGRLLPIGALREIVADLIDIHGQHEHQSLLSPDKHVLLLDSWLGDPALALRGAVAAQHADLLRLKRALEDIRTEARERARNLDLYIYQRDEIEVAGLEAGEEEELAAQRTRLASAEKLRAASDDAYDALSDSGVDGLSAALVSVERAAALDSELEPIRSALTEAVSYADDARNQLRRYRDRIEFNPERLEEIESRLSLIHTLKRKYGESAEEILAFHSELADKITGLQNQEMRAASLEKDISNSEAQLVQTCVKLTEMRRIGSLRFAKDLGNQLADLGMAATRFEISMEAATPGPRGADCIEFLISANPGEPLRPLSKVASGGELSRVMLAMKSVLAQAAFIPTLIFDEIDVGVGGRTASVIAEKLRSLAQSAQVLCITHLAQIASRPAAAHFVIEKQAAGTRTQVSVRRLTADERTDEIVRMLGGDSDSNTAVQHAREMLTGKPQ